MNSIKHFFLFFTYLTLPFFVDASGPDSLDTSFNSVGYLSKVFSNGTTTYGNAIILQDDGKSIIAGVSGSSGFLARYNIDGSLDTTFNSSGFVIVSSMSAINNCILQPGGKIVATGTPANGGQTVLVRYLSDGTLDTTFGSGGSTTTGYMSASYGIALQSTGYIIISGTNGSAGIVMQFTADGESNTSFGSFGTTTISAGSEVVAYAVQIQDDDSIIAAGYTLATAFVTRITTTGSIDISFGNAGYFATTVNGSGGFAYGLALQQDGKILLCGGTYNNQGFLMRVNENGTLDTTFAAPTGYTLNAAGYTDIALQANQQILVCGYKSNPLIRIVRYDTDGTIDATCNFTMISSPGTSLANSIALQDDGKFITTGYFKNSSVNSNKNTLSMVRLLGGQTPVTPPVITASTYGYNSQWLSEFFYVDAYAQVISDTTARAATIAATNAILSNFATTYANQPSFNFVSYAYLMNEDLAAAELTLTSAYPNSSSQITQFFEYIIKRETKLLS